MYVFNFSSVAYVLKELKRVKKNSVIIPSNFLFSFRALVIFVVFILFSEYACYLNAYVKPFIRQKLINCKIENKMGKRRKNSSRSEIFSALISAQWRCFQLIMRLSRARAWRNSCINNVQVSSWRWYISDKLSRRSERSQWTFYHT